jgi:hypothetical protein
VLSRSPSAVLISALTADLLPAFLLLQQLLPPCVLL